jgi:hypothetical protein
MKRIFCSVIFVFFMSCGGIQPPSSSTNRIVIQFRDSIIRDYYLLSVRENALVVAPYQSSYFPIDSLIASASVIPFSKIEGLFKKSRPSGSDVAGWGFLGFLVGSGSGFFTAIPYAYSHGGDSRRPIENFNFAIGTGFITGILIGIFHNMSDEEFYLNSKEHIDQVRKRAVYPNYEPYELQQKR